MRRSVAAPITWGSGVFLLLATPARSQQTSGNYAGAITAARTLITESLRSRPVPALSVAVAANGKVVWSEAFGRATLDPAVPATPTTLFRVGSVSKPITTAALMRLRESGRIHLDTSIRRYVPEWPAWHPVFSVSQLASHLSGVRHYQGAEFSSAQRFETVIASLTIFKNDSLLFAPGSRFAYSTYGYTLLSAAIERAAGVPFLAYVDSVVVRPLGLKHTMPDYADSVWSERATFYHGYPDGSWRAAPKIDQSGKWAGGGYLSTAEDMAKLGSALLRPGFLTAESLSLLFRERTLPTGAPTGYGIGWFVGADSAGHKIVYHGGSSVGGTAMLNLHLDDQVVVSMLVNTGATRLVNSLSEQIAHLFVQSRG